MSTNYRRFNGSTSENYRSDTKLANGNLSWDDTNGLRLHDGETPRGNPIIGVHERLDTQGGNITNVNSLGNGTFVIATGDWTGYSWAQLGQVIYFERDISENPQTITSTTFNGGDNVTAFTVNGGSFNGYTPNNGEYIYQTIRATPINQLAEGPGIALEKDGQRITITPRFFGQDTQYLSEYTLNNGLQMNTLPATLITVYQDPGYTTGTMGETHTLTLPFDGMQNPYWNPEANLCVGTRVTIINDTQFNLEVTGWPGPGFTLQPYGSTVDLVYRNNPDFGGNLWHVVGSFSWL